MRSCVRFSLLALLVGALLSVSAPTALGAEAPAIEKFIATNCTVSTCGQENVLGPFNEPKAKITTEEAKNEGFTQAGGRVPFGITDFKIATTGSYPDKVPTSLVTHLRTDVAPGLATNPFAVPQCSLANFGTTEVGKGVFAAPKCGGSELGTNEVTVWLGPEANTDAPLSGTVYDLEPEAGLASEFGVAINLLPITGVEVFAHTLIKGNVEWGKQPNGTNQGDYHDYFEIDVSPELPLIRSRLTFEGKRGGNFITNATSCPGHNTTTLKMTDLEQTVVKNEFTTPIGLSGCNLVPFNPSFSLLTGQTSHDEPDEITTEVGVPRAPENEIDSAQLKTASFTLPEGMTLNPSAAAGLSACTPAQARIHSSEKGVGCPASSEIGTVELTVPTLPEKENGEVPLKGKLYLGGPESGPITGPPYIVYLDAESARYGVSVRIKGETIPNLATGRVTTVFNENPEQPFTNVKLHFGRGALTAIANPLTCGSASTEGTFLPFTENPSKVVNSAFLPSGCPSPLPFSLTQGTVNQTTTAGGKTNYTFNLNRENGQQYLQKVQTTLPSGLVGAIPSVTLCTEAQANSNTCPATSQIGTASASSGSGPAPFAFNGGTVYMTGPYNGAPYGLAIVIPAVAGPFNLGPAIARAAINVNETTARVTTTAYIPTIVGGIPTRIRNLSVSINKQGFLYNPTNCGPLATESTLTGYTPGVSGSVTQNISSPFQVGNCSALKFKPAFKASTNGNTSKANGAGLTTTLTPVAGQANIKSVKVQLPKALPSRLTTLQKACTEAVFAANPFSCPSGSFVGGATVITPTLPGKMTGPAILVSHGGEAFPDLDLVVQSNGVRVVLVGNTDIKGGITTTTFASTPDVPVTGVTVNLPIGSHSALAANANLCANSLVMPTTITGQNGVVVKQNTKISVGNCGVRIVGHKVVGSTAFLTVQTYGAGRISGKGSGLATVFRRFGSAQSRATLKVPLSGGGRSRRRPFHVRLRVGFVPKAKGGKASAAFVTVSFR